MEDNNIFSDDNNSSLSIDPEKNYYEELVGEGKKFKDEQALARAKAESDSFIERMKAENEKLRLELQKSETAEEILKKIQESSVPKATPQTPSSNQPESRPSSSLSQEDLDRLIEEKMKVRESETKADQNYRQVVEALTAAWGSHNLVTELSKKAMELGMDKKELESYARTNPKAFLKLVDVNSTPSQQQARARVPESSVNTSSFGNSNNGVKNKAYYDKLRKEMGNSAFFSPKIQNEMHQQAIALGSKFFEN